MSLVSAGILETEYGVSFFIQCNDMQRLQSSETISAWALVCLDECIHLLTNKFAITVVTVCLSL